jgi:hypothetical protein
MPTGPERAGVVLGAETALQPAPRGHDARVVARQPASDQGAQSVGGHRAVGVVPFAAKPVAAPGRAVLLGKRCRALQVLGGAALRDRTSGRTPSEVRRGSDLAVALSE